MMGLGKRSTLVRAEASGDLAPSRIPNESMSTQLGGLRVELLQDGEAGLGAGAFRNVC